MKKLNTYNLRTDLKNDNQNKEKTNMKNNFTNNSLKEKIVSISKLIQKDQIEEHGDSSVNLENIQEMLNVDEATAVRVAEVSYYLMSDAIADEVIYQNIDYGNSVLAAFWHEVLVNVWKAFVYYVVDKITKEELEKCLSDALQNKDEYEVSMDEVVTILLSYLDMLVMRIGAVVDEDLFSLDVVFALANLEELSEDDLWTLEKLMDAIKKKISW